ncbi:G-beta repeat-containing protein [Hexamita inflata]|uniref:G-beta repeat-containing protein n=1 Tax=Hexamita inflata TaxID=28002 RepID=A0ABP1I973_9EUKA
MDKTPINNPISQLSIPKDILKPKLTINPIKSDGPQKKLQLKLNMPSGLKTGIALSNMKVDPDRVALNNLNNPGEQRQQFVPRTVQDFWLSLKIGSAYIPNKYVDYSQQERLSVVRVSLLERNEQGSFWPLKKSDPAILSTIQHEQQSDLNAKTSSPIAQVVQVQTQPQTIFPNSQFFQNNQFLQIDDFPISNSSITKFENERLIFNDKMDSVAKNAFVHFEVVQIPTWRNTKEKVLGWGMYKLSEVERVRDKKINLRLFEYKNQEHMQAEMVKIYQIRPQIPDIENLDAESITKEMFNVKGLYNPKTIGQLHTKFSYLDKDQIIQERLVKKTPVYPYDKELNAADIEADKSVHEGTEVDINFVDFTKFDMKAKLYLDQLNQISSAQGSGATVFNSEKVNCSTFTSNSVSAVTSPSQGNIALGAAAVLCDSGEYNIVLYNIATGQLLCCLGTHYGYVYALKFSPDCRFLLSCSADGTISVYDVQAFVYYGFNYYKGKKQETINKELQIIQAKRKNEKIKENYEQIYKDFEQFVKNTVVKNTGSFQFGDFNNDLELMEILTKLSNELGSDLNKMLVNLSSETMEQLQSRFLVYQINQGVCIYDLGFLNSKIPELLNAKQIGIMHDLKLKRQFFPVDIQIISGNLSGQVLYNRILHLEKEKRHTTTQTLVCQHEDYVNAIKTNQMTERCLVVSGDSSGCVKFIDVRVQNGSITAKVQSEIQTLHGLKDIALLKTRTKELRLVVLNGFGCCQVYDSTGLQISQINEEVEKYNNSQATKIDFQIQKLQFPGNCRLQTDQAKKICYVPVYGAGVVEISPTGRIMSAMYVMGQIQYGCFISSIQHTNLGLIVSLNSISQENKQTLAGFTPAGIPKYQQLPLFIINCFGNFVQRKFVNGNIMSVSGENDQLQQQMETVNEEEINEAPIVRVEEDFSKQVKGFLDFIKDQRTRMKE